ncbi:hypothetical protein EJ110_NYTH29393 [Nymphaea thermarum]|nr:hypothetical protein EJ110_NYTH29393 [Nymphaea thermarum]
MPSIRMLDSTMTQKQVLFKGQQKKKTLPPSRHGKPPQGRKGKPPNLPLFTNSSSSYRDC